MLLIIFMAGCVVMLCAVSNIYGWVCCVGHPPVSNIYGWVCHGALSVATHLLVIFMAGCSVLLVIFMDG